MDGSAFVGYRATLIRGYAQEKVRAGAWAPAEAEGRAQGDVDSLLPAGEETQGHYLYVVRDEGLGAEVGVLWFATEDSGTGPRVWVYDIVIYEGFRRRGYGTRALELLERKASGLGAGRVGLHVFGHNHGARKLYEALGYEVTDLTMSKGLAGYDG